MFSCQNEEVKIIEKPNKETKAIDMATLMFCVREANPITGEIIDCYCQPNGKHCLNEVTVTASIVNDVNDVFEVIRLGNNNEIISSFISHERLLKDLIPDYLIDGVLDSVYTVKITGDIEGENIAYVQFYDRENVLIMVSQLKK